MSPLPPDPYKILGVPKDAPITEIRSAHRKLVLKCHPDKIQDPALKAQKQAEFQSVQQAYELLSDDLERQKYDEKVKLEDLRKQFQNKANISTPRSAPRYSGQDEARGAESRASPFKAGASPPTASYAYNRFSDEDLHRGARVFEATPRSSRRETGYTEKASKREGERDRERDRERERDRDRDRERERERERDRDRDARDREREREKDKERERERRRREEAVKRAEKEAKEARRAEKRAREKQRDKDIKREADEKKRYAKPYIEPYDDEHAPPKSEKKKSSSSKKHDEKRDRSSGREETPAPVPAPPPPPMPQRSYTSNLDYATSYIQASKAKVSTVPGLQRSPTYHVRTVQPPAPTPPPGPSGPFAVPDDDEARRSSAKPRRGSGDGPRLSRERSYRGSSREALDDPPIVSASPSGRHPAQFPKQGSAASAMSASPPRPDLTRNKTMPAEAGIYSRSPAGISRSQTFNAFGETAEHPQGRSRSRLQPQVELESDSEDLYERRRDRKHRSSRRHHSPEPMRTENVSRYQVDGSRSRLHSSYTRRVDPELVEPYTYYVHPQDARPSMPVREASYTAATATAKFPKVKTSKAYGYDDVQYSYYDKPPREEYVAYA